MKKLILILLSFHLLAFLAATSLCVSWEEPSTNVEEIFNAAEDQSGPLELTIDVPGPDDYTLQLQYEISGATITKTEDDPPDEWDTHNYFRKIEGVIDKDELHISATATVHKGEGPWDSYVAILLNGEVIKEQRLPGSGEVKLDAIVPTTEARDYEIEIVLTSVINYYVTVKGPLSRQTSIQPPSQPPSFQPPECDRLSVSLDDFKGADKCILNTKVYEICSGNKNGVSRADLYYRIWPTQNAAYTEQTGLTDYGGEYSISIPVGTQRVDVYASKAEWDDAWTNIYYCCGEASPEEAVTGIYGDVLEAVLLDPIPGTFVTATNLETGAIKTVAANPDGTYFISVPPGHYKVQASAPGYLTSTGMFGDDVKVRSPKEEPWEKDCCRTNLIFRLVISSSTLLYSDDFSDSNSGWPKASSSPNEYTTGYINGKYYITEKKTHFSHWSGPSNPRFEDLIIEVEATKQSGPDGCFGVVLRRTENYYSLQISSNGYYCFIKHLGNKNVDIVPWTKSEAIRQGEATNIIRVESEGDRFTFYVNDVKVGEAQDSSISSGKIGLIAGTFDEPNFDVSFDNLKVWALNKG